MKGKLRLSKEVIDTVANCIANGKTLCATANELKVNRNTLYGWYRKGRESDSGLYKDLYEAVESAKDCYEQSLLDRIQSISSNGELLTKTKEQNNPDGTTITVKEVSENNKFAATKWILERRLGYSDKTNQKVFNKVLQVVQNTLIKAGHGELYSQILEKLMEDDQIASYDIEDRLFLTE